jgi:hypothetical protein
MLRLVDGWMLGGIRVGLFDRCLRCVQFEGLFHRFIVFAGRLDACPTASHDVEIPALLSHDHFSLSLTEFSAASCVPGKLIQARAIPEERQSFADAPAGVSGLQKYKSGKEVHLLVANFTDNGRSRASLSTPCAERTA